MRWLVVFAWLGLTSYGLVAAQNPPTSATATPVGPNGPTTSSQPSSEGGGSVFRPLSPAEQRQLEQLRVEKEIEERIIAWAQARFWIIAVLILLIGFFGVRALVREMISNELREATRAAAQAQIAAEMTREATREAQADAARYRTLVADLTETAGKLDERLGDVRARIEAEGAHAIASTELQLSDVSQRLDELANVVRQLASDHVMSRNALKEYDSKMTQLAVMAERRRTSFTENSHYSVVVAYNETSRTASKFAQRLIDELAQRGYRTVDGHSAFKGNEVLNKIEIIHDETEEFVSRLRQLVETVASRFALPVPVTARKHEGSALGHSAVVVLGG